MAKKSFKAVADDNPALAFLGKQADDENIHSVQNEELVHDVDSVHDVRHIQYCNINLRITQKMKDFLTDESWKARMNVTQYINALIKADMDAKWSGG